MQNGRRVTPPMESPVHQKAWQMDLDYRMGPAFERSRSVAEEPEKVAPNSIGFMVDITIVNGGYNNL